MARRNPRKLPWNRQPKILSRVRRVWGMYQEGVSFIEMAEREGVVYMTINRDMTRARELLAEETKIGIVSTTQDAIEKRQHAQKKLYDYQGIDKEADRKGRAALSESWRRNQGEIEELQGSRPFGKGDTSAQANVLVISLDGEKKQVLDMSDTQLEQLQERLGGNGADGDE